MNISITQIVQAAERACCLCNAGGKPFNLALYYDLILMDIQMPNMDGYKAAQTIRKLSDPQKANITIVAMTANAFDEDKKNAYKAGMNWHISKPINRVW